MWVILELQGSHSASGVFLDDKPDKKKHRKKCEVLDTILGFVHIHK